MRIQGKVFVVTGGGNGIGREVVLAIVAKGGRVASVDISEKGLNETLALAGDKADQISNHAIDLTDRAAVQALPEAVLAAHKVVDGVINVAGVIQPFMKVHDLSFADIERVMDINFYGPLNITKTFLPILLERPEAHLVAVSSMGGFLAVPGQTAYGASKAALKLLFEGLYAELLTTDVGVSVVFPGAIETNIAANSGVAMDAPDEDAPSFPMTPAPVAAQEILRAVEQKRYHLCIGKDAKFLDAFTRAMPERASRFITKQMGSLLKS